MIFLPKCGCAERSREGQVFTCPECCAAALLVLEGHAVDQGELFSEVDTLGSVSALSRGRGELTHIADVLRASRVLDGLPF